MHTVDTIVADLGPAEIMAIRTRSATQQTADRLARKGLSRFVKGPPRQAYARTVRIGIDLTEMGETVARALDAGTATS